MHHFQLLQTQTTIKKPLNKLKRVKFPFTKSTRKQKTKTRKTKKMIDHTSPNMADPPTTSILLHAKS